MLETVDKQWIKGEFNLFKDEGKVSPGSVTHKFSVWDRLSSAMVGIIRWQNTWRQYIFFPSGRPMSPKTAREIFDFAEQATKLHREKRSQT